MDESRKKRREPIESLMDSVELNPAAMLSGLVTVVVLFVIAFVIAVNRLGFVD